jgi:hypothetical protein
MVQTISKYGGNLPLSANFEPTGTSGLNFGVSAGAVTGFGAIVESAAGNVTVPGSSSWSIYASYTTGLLVASATSAVPATDALILFHGQSNSSAISSWVDVRSFASTASISAGVGFNEYLTTNFTLDYDWRLNESSGTNQDDGVLTDIPLNGNPNITYSETGDVSYETDDAIGLNGTSAYASQTSAGNFPNESTGSIGMVFASDTSYGASDILIDMGDATTTSFCMVRLTNGSGNARVEFRVLDTTSGYDAHTQSANLGATASFDDGNYNMLVITQAADGNGPLFYMNGASVAQGFTNYTTGGAANDWFVDKQTNGRFAIGSATALGNNLFDGRVARVWIASEVMTPTEIATLNSARSAPV